MLKIASDCFALRMERVIAVIADSPIPDRPCRDLLRHIRDAGFKALYVPISRLSVEVGNDGVSVVIRNRPFRPDGVFLRSLGLLIDVEMFFRRYTTMRIVEESGCVVINPLKGLITTRNKLETIVELKRHGIPVPYTLGTEDIIYAYEAAKALGEVVLKPIQGSRGFGAVRAPDPDIAFQYMKTLLTVKKPIYMQEYVRKPNRDVRIMVIDGEVFACMIREAPPNQWKTNIAQGAIGRPCDKVDPAIFEIAIRAVEALGLVYGGVDIGEGENGPVVFEVNGSPDWTELTSVTGKNPAKALVDVMKRKLRI